MDSQVELGKVFRPLSLTSGKLLGSGKVFKVLMVSENIDGNGRSLKVVTPNMNAAKIASNSLS